MGHRQCERLRLGAAGAVRGATAGHRALQSRDRCARTITLHVGRGRASASLQQYLGALPLVPLQGPQPTKSSGPLEHSRSLGKARTAAHEYPENAKSETSSAQPRHVGQRATSAAHTRPRVKREEWWCGEVGVAVLRPIFVPSRQRQDLSVLVHARRIRAREGRGGAAKPVFPGTSTSHQ